MLNDVFMIELDLAVSTMVTQDVQGVTLSRIFVERYLGCYLSFHGPCGDTPINDRAKEFGRLSSRVLLYGSNGSTV